MKTVRDVMTTEVVRLSPTNKIKTAIILMKGHSIGGLPVLDGERVVGTLDCLSILGKDTDILVQNVMDREFITIPPDMAVADAGDLMAKIGSGRLLVLEGGHLVGIVTRGDLLPELGKSVDPITGLPRADAMRDWGINALKRGLEITVLFLDLDHFGHFNKKYGHITGDKVLRHIAGILQSRVDDERDMLCRYAGDEFVIVTTRDAEEARMLASLLADDIRHTSNPALPDPVTGSFGVHGGKRTKERDHVHYEATLDNLINLASKACTLAKGEGITASPRDHSDSPMVTAANGGSEPTPAMVLSLEPVLDHGGEPASTPTPIPSRAPQPPVSGEPASRTGESKRLRIEMLNIRFTGDSAANIEIELAHGDRIAKRSCGGYATGSSALRLVAEATAQAACEFLPKPGYGVVVENVEIVRGAVGENIALVAVVLVSPRSQKRVSGSCIVDHDTYTAISSALLNALNRQISLLI